jgi:hypothetical protein
MSEVPANGPRLDIDAEVITAYCHAVFKHVDGIVPVRVLSETGTAPQRPRQWFPLRADLPGILRNQARWAADDGCGVYVVPCTVGPGQFRRAGRPAPKTSCRPA